MFRKDMAKVKVGRRPASSHRPADRKARASGSLSPLHAMGRVEQAFAEQTSTLPYVAAGQHNAELSQGYDASRQLPFDVWAGETNAETTWAYHHDLQQRHSTPYDHHLSAPNISVNGTSMKHDKTLETASRPRNEPIADRSEEEARPHMNKIFQSGVNEPYQPLPPRQPMLQSQSQIQLQPHRSCMCLQCQQDLLSTSSGPNSPVKTGYDLLASTLTTSIPDTTKSETGSCTSSTNKDAQTAPAPPTSSSQPSKPSDKPINPLYRTFSTLHHRLLLHLQDELSEMEEHLSGLDTLIAATTPPTLGNDKTPFPASRRAEAQDSTGLHFQRRHLLGAIFVKIEQYDKTLRRFIHVVDDFEPAEKEGVDTYKAFLEKEKCIHGTEMKFLNHKDDLVVVPGTVDRSEAGKARRNKRNGAGSDVPMEVVCTSLFLLLLAFVLAVWIVAVN